MRRILSLSVLPALSLAGFGAFIPAVDFEIAGRLPDHARPTRVHGKGVAAKPKRKANRLTCARKAKARRRRARNAA